MENSHNTPLLLQPIQKKILYSIIFWATWTHLFAFFFIDHSANHVSSWVTFCTCLTHLWQISQQLMKTPYKSQNGVLAELFYLWTLECSKGRIREAGGGQRQWCSIAAFPILSLPLHIQLCKVISVEGHMNEEWGLLPLSSVLREGKDGRTGENWVALRIHSGFKVWLNWTGKDSSVTALTVWVRMEICVTYLRGQVIAVESFRGDNSEVYVLYARC